MSKHGKINDGSLEDDQREGGPSYIKPYSLKTKIFTCILIRVFRIYSRLRDRKEDAEIATKSLQKLLLVSLRKNHHLRKEIGELKDELNKKNNE